MERISKILSFLKRRSKENPKSEKNMTNSCKMFFIHHFYDIIYEYKWKRV